MVAGGSSYRYGVGWVMPTKALGLETLANEIVYLKRLNTLQHDLIARYHEYLLAFNPAHSIDDASPREWDLSTRCYYLQKDNDALRELAEEYRGLLNDKSN